jgi:zinc protease
MTLSFRSAWLVAALALGLSACGPSGAPQTDGSGAAQANFPHEASDLPADEGVRYGVLENGMRYAIMENDTPTGTAAMRLVFDVGSLAEADDQRGLAHFIEHMTFNGTTNVPEGEMIPLLERYGLAFGPDTNAFTGREVVGYQLDLPSTEDQLLDVGLFLLRETASEIVFDADAIERERGIIMGEMRTRDTPVRRFFNAYYDFLFPGTLVTARDAIGVAEVIENAGPEPFQRYYNDFYTPERAMLVVTGDIDADAIEARIRDGFSIDTPGLSVTEVESFATWAQPDPAAPNPDIGSVEAGDAPQFGYFYDPDVFTIVTVDVVEPGVAAGDSRAHRLADLKRQLGNAIVQRRIQSLVNRGDSPLVQANVSYVGEFGLVTRAGMLGVASPDRWREGVALLENELRRALEHGFTQSELDEQMANLRTALRNGADQAETRSTTALADAIWGAWISDEVFVHPAYALDWFQSIEGELTVDAVETAFEDIWTAAPAQVFAALNIELDNGEAAVREAWRAASAEPVDPPQETANEDFAYGDFGAPGVVASRAQVEDLGLTQLEFENGVRLTVKPTDFEDGVVRVRIEFGAGDLTPQPSPAAGAIVGAAFGGGGLEAHDRDALQRLLAGRSVGYGVGVSDDRFFFSNATTPTDAELQMQVLAAFMTAPGWRADGLNQFRSIAEEVRRGQNASAVQVATNRVSRLLRSGDPRWGFPTADEVAAFTMDDARALLGPALESAPLEITLVGDISVERAIEITASTFGALPARDDTWPDYESNAAINFPEPAAEPQVVRFNGEPNQGMANIYYPAGDGFDPQRRAEMSLLESVFRLKALDRFRERDGATYSPIVSAQLSRVFPDFGIIWVGLDVDVNDVPAMYAVTDEVAATLAAGEISEDELQRARQPILEQIEESRERNAFWVNALSRSQAEPDRLDDIRTIQARFEAVTVADLTALAAQVLRPETALRVSILPEGVDPEPAE